MVKRLAEGLQFIKAIGWYILQKHLQKEISAT